MRTYPASHRWVRYPIGLFALILSVLAPSACSTPADAPDPPDRIAPFEIDNGPAETENGRLERDPAEASAPRPLENPDEDLGQDPAVRTGRLENGLEYYIRPNSEPNNRAMLRLAVNAGSILEEDDQLGLAHFVEHMAFAGTENFEADEIIAYLEEIGMRFGPHVNAYVSFDETVYMLEVPTEDDEVLERAFHIMEEWAHRMALDPAKIERERGVIIEEWRLGLGSSQRLREQQFPVIFQDSRYAERLPIGDMDVIREFEPEALERFYREWYRPDLMAIVAVGDFDPDNVERLIATYFSRIDEPETPRTREFFGVPAHDETLYAVASDPEQPYTQVSIYNKADIEPLRTRGDYRTQILNRLYGRMMNARFTEIVQRPDSPILSGSSGASRLVRSAGIYYLTAIVDDDGVASGLRTLVEEAMRVQEHGFTESEFERAKRTELRGVERAYRQQDQVGSRQFASEYVRAFLEQEAFPGIEAEYHLYQEMLPEIQLPEVNRLADNYLAERNRVVVVSMVDRPGAELPDEQTLAEAVSSVDRAALQPYEDTDPGDTIEVVYGSPGEFVEERHREEIDTHEWTFENGARVVVKPTDFRNDEILFQAFGYGGASVVPDEHYIDAVLATTLVSEAGIGAHSQNDLRRILSGRATAVRPFIDTNVQGLSGSTSPEDVELLLDLIALHFDPPRFDEDVFDSVRRRVQSSLANAEAQPNFQFSSTLQRLLWQNHPRSRPITAERLTELDYSNSVDIYRDRFADPGSFTYVFVGNIDVDEFRALTARTIGALPGLGREKSIVDTGMRFPEERIVETVHAGLAPQSFVAIVFNGDHNYEQSRNIPLRVLGEALRIRLREVLREGEGAVYALSAQGSPQQYPWERYIVEIVFGTDPEEAARLSELTREEIARIRAGKLDESYATRAREAQARSYETGLRENGFWLSNLYSLYLNNRDPLDIVRFPDVLSQIDRDSLIDAANRFLRDEQFIQLILYPESSSQESR